MSFQTSKRLARRLLNRAPKLVSDSIFFGLVMYSVGCIVPTNLEEQPQETKFPPSFVKGGESPPFGKLQHTASEAWPWQIKASDPNLDDPLTARISLCDLTDPDNDKKCSWLIDIPLLRVPSTDPSTKFDRIGASDSRPWCLNVIAKTYQARVLVSDAPFADKVSSSSVTTGLVAENHWELECD